MSDPSAGPETTASASIENTLPADGCSYPVTINNVAYAPDAASEAAIRDRMIPYGTHDFTITYRVTGRTGQVICGFGSHRTLPEISFVFEAGE